MTGRASQRRFRITALFAAAALALSGAAGADMAVGGGGKPPKPTGLTVAATATSLTLSWNPAGGAASYGLYLDTQPVGTTTATSWTFSNLACGTTHQLGVDTI